MKLLQLSFFCSLFLSMNSSVVQGQTDDFDDGNDDGWARVNTLAGQGVPATWGFPNNNSYSIAMAGHGIEQLGQPRAGSFREEVTYSDFYIAVAIIGIKLIIQVIFYKIFIPEYLFFLIMLCLFFWGFSNKDTSIENF